MVKKYISYSLWGNAPIYTIGMLNNIKQANKIYPGWQIIVYHDAGVDQQILNEIEARGAITVKINEQIYGMFWRFFAADLPDCDYVIFRDSDSRLSEREREAVDTWIESNKILHIMRDHPYHQHPIDNQYYQILGGMWGIKGRQCPITSMIHKYALEKDLHYGSDQLFLNAVYELFKNSATVHDEFFAGIPFPSARKNYRFIGERYDEHNHIVGDDWKIIRQYYLQKKWYYKAGIMIKNKLKRSF